MFETKPASEIEPGDVLYVPTEELHPDLSGLTAEIAVDRVEQSKDGYIDVYQAGREDRIWWKPQEVVKFRNYIDNKKITW